MDLGRQRLSPSPHSLAASRRTRARDFPFDACNAQEKCETGGGYSHQSRQKYVPSLGPPPTGLSRSASWEPISRRTGQVLNRGPQAGWERGRARLTVDRDLAAAPFWHLAQRVRIAGRGPRMRRSTRLHFIEFWIMGLRHGQPHPLHNLRATLLPSTTSSPELGAILGEQCSASSERGNTGRRKGRAARSLHRACDVDR